MIAYHFCGATLRDGRPIPADGEWLVHEGQVTICETGLHASSHPFDALQFAPGATLCIVECEDIVTEHVDKLVCRRRKIVKRIDATELLWKASREYAKSVLHLWDAPQVVKDFLDTGDESLMASARAAARAAARDAGWDAGWDAAWDAARDAAWAAARAAGWAAARAAQRDLFAKLVEEAFGHV